MAAADAALARAERLESAGDARCVEAYFAACAWSWQACYENLPAPAAHARHHYRAALTGLLRTGQRFCRLDPCRGLFVRAGDQWQTVPVAFQGFAWSPADFQQLRPPPRGREPLLSRRYERPGWGVPLVVERRRNEDDAVEARFFPERSAFAATAVLRFGSDGAAGDDAPECGGVTLLFYNPQAISAVDVAGPTVPLAADLSAPLAALLEEAPRTYLAGFIEPGRANAFARLNFLEPYQPGKIPVVLIHGLFSDPLSWADLINDLRAAPGFDNRFQVWTYRYPTGQGFLQSAARLRRELEDAVAVLNPAGDDPALRRMVLVGHSMGGLIAKLQVAHSEERVWSLLANRPLETIVTTESTRAMLAETCFFEPAPHVERVVFIAAPHMGSLEASGLVGRSAALLVEPAPEQEAMLEQLLRDNPDTFNPLVARRLPTSIDMLEPRSPLLAVMRQMRLGPDVKLHNIVGVWHPVSLDGPSDGVVSVNSASHPGCQSVLAVNAPHGRVHRALETSAEILRILSCHAPFAAPPEGGAAAELPGGLPATRPGPAPDRPEDLPRPPAPRTAGSDRR